MELSYTANVHVPNIFHLIYLHFFLLFPLKTQTDNILTRVILAFYPVTIY